MSSLGLIEVFGAIAYSSIRSEDLIEDLYQALKSPESLPVLSAFSLDFLGFGVYTFMTRLRVLKLASAESGEQKRRQSPDVLHRRLFPLFTTSRHGGQQNRKYLLPALLAALTHQGG